MCSVVEFAQILHVFGSGVSFPPYLFASISSQESSFSFAQLSNPYHANQQQLYLQNTCIQIVSLQGSI